MADTTAERVARHRAKRRLELGLPPPRKKREGPRVQISPAQRLMLDRLTVGPVSTTDGYKKKTLRALEAKGLITTRIEDDTMHATKRGATK